METSNEKKFQQLFPNELYVLQHNGGAAYQHLLREENKYFSAIQHGRKQEAYEHIENIYQILAVEEVPEERQKDFQRFFTFLAGAFAKYFSRTFSFSWEFLATATTMMKVIETWETEEDYREGMYFVTNTFTRTINAHQGDVYAHPKIAKYLYFIQDRLYEPLNTKIVAAHLDISTGHLNRLVREHLNQSCAMYIREKKLEESIYLLYDPNKTIGEIADTLAMSHGNFIRIFQKKYGVSPSSYRKRLAAPMIKEPGDGMRL
ncbi:helix-turn-helix transcriptional regulator [Halobacillus salinus]|uniref:helix-turn-helix transcriptional regulator n=1 Tax=Halobacillus salinus TaxID=192814 RepID=UPI001591E5FA|nr:AraC family transcriptional regulator [Halobacillus salinus]